MNAKTVRILVTGAAGFIGYHLCKRLTEEHYEVTGIDNLNEYYDVRLKLSRMSRLEAHDVTFKKTDITDDAELARLFSSGTFDAVVHLAAQVGARHSIQHPKEYFINNVDGFLNVLEGCRTNKVKHLLFASSSSVYGLNDPPFSVQQRTDLPMTPYAVTKKTNELMAFNYAHLYGLPATGVRLFTVYGPWGRPDMSYFLFAESIMASKAINVYNYGKTIRDFTYIDDAVEAIIRLLPRAPGGQASGSASTENGRGNQAPFRIYNIGQNKPVKLASVIALIEQAVGKKATINYLPEQPGDPPVTAADVAGLERDIGYRPSTSLEQGIRRFIEWYKEYYAVEK